MVQTDKHQIQKKDKENQRYYMVINIIKEYNKTVTHSSIENPGKLWNIGNSASNNNTRIFQSRQLPKHCWYKWGLSFSCSANKSNQTANWYV